MISGRISVFKQQFVLSFLKREGRTMTAKSYLQSASCATRTTDTPMTALFSSIPNILANWAGWLNKFWGILGYFCHCLSLVPNITLLSHFFCKKLRFSYIAQYRIVKVFRDMILCFMFVSIHFGNFVFSHFCHVGCMIFCAMFSICKAKQTRRKC